MASGSPSTRIDGAYVLLPVRPEALARARCPSGLRRLQSDAAAQGRGARGGRRGRGGARRIGAVNTVVVAADGTLGAATPTAFGFLENLSAELPDGAPRPVPPWCSAPAAPRARSSRRSSTRARRRSVSSTGRARAAALAARSAGRSRRRLGGPRGGARGRDAAGERHQSRHVRSAGPGSRARRAAARRRGERHRLCAARDGAARCGAAARQPLVDGLGMLLHQARPGFAAWFGPLPEVTPALRAAGRCQLAPR